MSKISRSLVVALFVALILFLGISDFTYINNIGNSVNSASNLMKIGYVFVVIILVSLYTYVKEKISRQMDN